MSVAPAAPTCVGKRRKDGTTFYTNVRMRAVRDEAGQTKFLEGFVEDITRRKHLEERLRQA